MQTRKTAEEALRIINDGLENFLQAVSYEGGRMEISSNTSKWNATIHDDEHGLKVNFTFDKTKKIVEKPSYVESPVSRRPKIKKDGILDQSQKWQEIAAIHSKILAKQNFSDYMLSSLVSIIYTTDLSKILRIDDQPMSIYADDAVAIWSTIDRLNKAGQILGRASYLWRAFYAYKDEEWNSAYVIPEVRKTLSSERKKALIQYKQDKSAFPEDFRTIEARVNHDLSVNHRLLVLLKFFGWKVMFFLVNIKGFGTYINKTTSTKIGEDITTISQYIWRLNLIVQGRHAECDRVIRNIFSPLSQTLFEKIQKIGHHDQFDYMPLYRWYSDQNGRCHRLDYEMINDYILTSSNPLGVEVEKFTYPLCRCEQLCNCMTNVHSPIEIFDAGEKGFGVRTLLKIPKGTIIGKYLGEIICPRPPGTDNDHYYDLDGHLPPGHQYFYIIRSEVRGNFTRFINHSCEQNCTAVACRAQNKAFIGIATIKEVGQGEELTLNYGDNYWRHGGCLCQSDKCKYR